jgi:rubrerythrin
MLWYSSAPVQLGESHRSMMALDGEFPRPQSLEEVLAIAHTMEREAATRYGDLARCMRLVGRSDLADLFHDLATAEQDHVAAVEDLSLQTLRRLPELPVAFQWRLPKTFGAEDRVVITNMLTPYEALVMAVYNEERAFAFWNSIAVVADDSAVREQAEMMARQELLHAAALRIARRRAYRAGGRLLGQARRSDAAEELEQIKRLQHHALLFLKDAAALSGGTGDHMTSTLLQFALEEIASAFKPQEQPSVGEDHAVGTSTDVITLLFDATGRMEQLTEAARDCVEAYPDLVRGHELSRLAKAAALQMAMLNRRLCELEPRLLALTAPVSQGRTRF